MLYQSINALQDFEFHDSEVIGGSRDGDTVTLTLKYLNVHKHLPQNPGDFDMEIELATFRINGFQLLGYTPGVTWGFDEAGNSIPLEPIREYTGADGLERFWTQVEGGFAILQLDTEQQNGRLALTFSCSGNEPYFDVSFAADQVTVQWDKFRKKAWYELHRYSNHPLSLLVDGAETPSEIRVYFHDDPPSKPLRSASIKLDGSDLWGSGTLLEEAVLDLERKLPASVSLKCCQTCRHGNFCPSGNEETEIFCLQDLHPASKGEVFDLLTAEGQWEHRKRTLFSLCDAYCPMEKAYYAYNDYYEMLYGAK